MNKTTTIGLFILLVVGMVASIGAASAFQGKWFNGENKEEIKTALEEGDFEGWKSLVRDGFNKKMDSMTEEDFQMMSERHAGMGHMKGKMQAVHEAVESNDYEAFKAAQEETSCPHAQSITEEEFPLFVEMHEAMQSGDHERAQEISDELDIQHGMHGKHMMR